MSTTTEATEGQAKIRQLLTDLRYGHFDSDAIGEINSMLDQALAILDASPPIVGGPKEMDTERIIDIAMVDLRVANGPGFVPSPYVLAETSLRVARDHGYLAQAPQSSPAPSVIEAGDANLERWIERAIAVMGGIRTDASLEGWIHQLHVCPRELRKAWDAAKASRPSVSAPNGSDVKNLHNAAREMRLQLCEFRAADKIPDRTWFKWNAALEATEHVLSLSPAPQGVTVDQDKCVHCGRLRSTPDEPNR